MQRRPLIKVLLACVVLFGLPIAALALLTSQDPSSEPPGPCASAAQALKQLRPHARAYAKASGAPTRKMARINDGVVPISEGRIDRDVYCALNRDLQARSPKDVRTVALIDYKDRLVGHYTGGGDAIAIVARLKIVDLESHRSYTPAREFLGSDPPDVVRRVGKGDVRESGDPPTRKIVRYLERLAGMPHT